MKAWNAVFRFFALCALAAASPAAASLTDCYDIYVIRILMSTSNGVPWVVFANTPNATVGSYFQYPSYSLPDRIYEQMYAILLTAKATRTPVAVVTDATGGCDIANGTHYLTSIELRPTP